MKFTIALILALVLCATQHSDAKPGLLVPALLTSSQYHTQDQLGQYSYGYSNPQSAKAEVKTADGITQGSYSYVDAEGKLQSVHYTADEINGFRVAGTNLPAPVLPIVAQVTQHHDSQQDSVEVAAAKSKLLDQQHEQLIQYQAHDHQEQQLAKEFKDKPLQTLAHHQLPLFKTSVLTYASPAVIPTLTHFAAPGFGYSYGYGYPHYAYLNHLPAITTYSAPYISATHIHHQLPAAPTETPEVAKARAEHIKAHEEAKARSL